MPANTPAFARPLSLNVLSVETPAQDGMTLRQWYAGMALGMIRSQGALVMRHQPEAIAKWAADMADAMIAELGE